MCHLSPDSTNPTPEHLAREALAALKLAAEQLQAATEAFMGGNTLDEAYASGERAREALIGDFFLTRIEDLQDLAEGVERDLQMTWPEAAHLLPKFFSHEAA